MHSSQIPSTGHDNTALSNAIILSVRHLFHTSPSAEVLAGMDRCATTSREGNEEEKATETTVLLGTSEEPLRTMNTGAASSSLALKPPSRSQTQIPNYGTDKLHGRRSVRTVDTTSPVFAREGLKTPRLSHSLILNTTIGDRAWYDQFTSTDWVHDSIADGYRSLELRKTKGLRGRLWIIFDSAQGWILMTIIGCVTAALAYVIDVAEAAIFDLKRGFCSQGWYLSRKACCAGAHSCQEWRTWSEVIHPSRPDLVTGNYIAFTLGCIVFAAIAWLLTSLSKTVIPSHIGSTFDENLGADKRRQTKADNDSLASRESLSDVPSAMTYYSAAGSGVAEVKVILSGFVLHGYLGFRTLLLKSPGLVFSVASGMSLGKEGPYVHIATCVGNIACRMFPKYNLNDGKRREVLSAAAAGGVTLAFGSPLGGVLFSLEEVSYYFPPKTLFRTFFCCIAAALSLKFLNPYGTNKIVFFEVRYLTTWRSYELFSFALLGIMGGLAGAGFIKASRLWATTFRRWKLIRAYPWAEVLLVALVTGLATFWNRYTNMAVAELLFEVVSPCGPDNHTGLCPKTKEEIPAIIGYLSVAFAIKAVLTIITFGIKVPAGIYVPSMVCGGLMGRIVAHIIQYVVLSSPVAVTLLGLPADTANTEDTMTPGVYALVAAGATMCGVTRLSVTLAVILFELTGSLDYVLPFAIGILAAKWTADYVEPNSIYDLLIDMNSYPFLDNRHTPLFDTELGDITSRVRNEKIIDLTISPYVRASELRRKLEVLHDAGELDGGLPLLREKALVGLIPAPDLEFALDRLEHPEDQTLCLMSNAGQFGQMTRHRRWFAALGEDDASILSRSSSISDDEGQSVHEVDFTAFVDPAPVALDIHSPMNLVYQCFSKLGLRWICVVEGGVYRGMVHKKRFVGYIKTCEAKRE